MNESDSNEISIPKYEFFACALFGLMPFGKYPSCIDSTLDNLEFLLIMINITIALSPKPFCYYIILYWSILFLSGCYKQSHCEPINFLC